MAGRIPPGRDLEKHRRGIVKEEVRKILQLVRVRVALQLADDRAERLCLGQDLHLGLKRLRPLELGAEAPRPRERLSVAERLLRERLLLAKRLALSKGFSKTPSLFPLPFSLFPIRPFRPNLSKIHSRVLLRPIGREVDGSEIEYAAVRFAHGLNP